MGRFLGIEYLWYLCLSGKTILITGVRKKLRRVGAIRQLPNRSKDRDYTLGLYKETENRT